MLDRIDADNLVWIDLEMTGLNPDRDVILEISVVITDRNLNIIAQGPELVVFQPETELEKMSDKVKGILARSGLIHQVTKSQISLSQAETEILSLVKKYCPPQTAPLCGNSVYVDRVFLMKHMPALHAYLLYRIIDVSTIKELYRRWYPSVKPFVKTETHRALADIKESIAELKYYRNHIFR